MPGPRRTCFALALLAGALALPGAAAAGDVFDFIPPGGRSLLIGAAGPNPAPPQVREILGGQRDAKQWLAYLREHRGALPGMAALGERELETLADYLAFNMPLPPTQLPGATLGANWARNLPPDGRDMALNYCQNCHVITVVVTQDKTREAWLGTMHKPSHTQVKLSEAQREALAAYLVRNAAIPIDQVPEELRVGGASY